VADADRIRVLIVGRPDRASAVELNSAAYSELRRRGVLATVLELADNNLQERCFAAADVVWVAYRNHSTMSGVFAQAMSCALPVIGPNYGLLSWLIKQYGVGISIDIDNPGRTGAQIVEMLRSDEMLRAFRRKAQLIARQHVPENFANSICDAIVSCLH
jgi:glycosyltransferase involved in cell wall biosynthesis